jgi:MoaA/NifB/PqqE/SkfB family radical SAM enzyme
LNIMPLDQVFLYVTQKCNIRCVTCYALDQLERSDDLPVADLLIVLRQLRAQGAWKLSFLGGEPTLHPALTAIASDAHAMGYRFVRINTNGMFKREWLDAESTRAIDAMCFSIDGATPEVNDAIRKGARLDRVIANMRHAAAIGYDVRANMTVTSRNVDQLFDVMTLVQDCGAKEINLNVMFEMGYAVGRDDLAVPPQRWHDAYREVIRRQAEFSLRIKVPPAFAAAEDIGHYRAEGHRCLAADQSRMYVASNGDVYPCLAMMDDRANRTSEYADGAVTATPTPSWRSPAAGDSIHDYCHFIHMRSDGLKPLCIFHKTRLNAVAHDRSLA